MISATYITSIIAQAQRAAADYLYQAALLDSYGNDPDSLYKKAQICIDGYENLQASNDLTDNEKQIIVEKLLLCGDIGNYATTPISFTSITVVFPATLSAKLSTLTDGPGGGTGTLVGSEYRVPVVNFDGSAWEYKKPGFQGTVLYVSPSGISGKVEKGSIIYHYPNITEAQTAASSGDTIVVMPGTYTDSGLGKNGVNYHFHLGATISATAAIWVSGSTMSYKVTGEGYFETTADIVCINITNASTVTIKARSIKGAAIEAGNFQARGASTLTIELTEDAISTTGYTFYVDGASTLYAKGRNNLAYITGIGISEVNSKAYLDFKEHRTTSVAHTSFGIILYGGGFLDIKGRLICNGTCPAVIITNATWVDNDLNIINIHDDIDINSTGNSFLSFGSSDFTLNTYGKIKGTSTGGRFLLQTNPKGKVNLYNEISINNTLSTINQTEGTLTVRSRVGARSNTNTANPINKSGGYLILDGATLVSTHASSSCVYASGTAQDALVFGAVANRASGGSTVLTEKINSINVNASVI